MEMKRTQKYISSGCSEHGFTMIELMIAMAVSLLALAAIYSTFLAQHRSYQVQSETADMQQNIRAAMYYMQREIRMAGSDPFNVGGIGITLANNNKITFTEDVNGGGSATAPDGLTTGTGENITYSLNGKDLKRTDSNANGGLGDTETVAQNIDAIDFVYLDGSSPPVVLNPGLANVPNANLNQIRSVEITVIARTDHPLLYGTTNNVQYKNQQDTTFWIAPGDNVSRRRLTTLIHCRNLGL
jgi:type IV pilus assembly protein PilW